MDEEYLGLRKMDNNLQRLKQELDSLWQSDEGLHTQMNSVIGALQELKLLQVQTALEKLDFSSKPSQISPFTSAPNTLILDQNNQSSRRTNLNQTQNLEECHKNEFGIDSSSFLTSSPLDNRNIPRTQAPMRIKHRGSLSTSSSFSSSNDDTLDSHNSSYDNDSSDWTSSLMNHSRNRQPLVLGDNAFADLVGNWLDLPDVGYQTAGEEVDDSSLKDTFIESSHTSHAQELSKRLSLTANIFKRVLRRVRPGKPQDRPGQLHEESEGMEVFKQPKITRRKPKEDTSNPFWARTRGLRKKTTPIQQEGVACQSSGGLIGWTETEKHHPKFDYSSAVWV